MSFVDGRAIRQRMAKKDARMAKIAAKRLAKSAKIVGAAECSSTQTAPDRNGQTLTEGAHRVTAIPHSIASPWRPIETAPKDGTPIITYGKEFNEEYMGYCRFMRYNDGSSGWAGGAFISKSGNSWVSHFEPSLWMPAIEWPTSAPANDEVRP